MSVCLAHSAAQASATRVHSWQSSSDQREPRARRVTQAAQIAAQSRHSLVHSASSGLVTQQSYAHASHACWHAEQASRYALCCSSIIVVAMIVPSLRRVFRRRFGRNAAVHVWRRGVGTSTAADPFTPPTLGYRQITSVGRGQMPPHEWPSGIRPPRDDGTSPQDCHEVVLSIAGSP